MKGFWVAGIFALSFSCTNSGYEVVREVDRREGVRRTYMIGNLVRAEGIADAHREVYLNALRLDWRTGEIVYYLVVRYNAETWLKIPAGNSMTLVANGKKMTLWSPGSGQKRNVFTDENGIGYHSEQAWYQAQPEELHELVSAGKIVMTIKGESGFIRRRLSPRNIQRLQTFVRKNVSPVKQEPHSFR